MPRKGENIRKRNDGRWEARFCTINTNGEKCYRSVYASGYLEVKRKRAQLLQSASTPSQVSKQELPQLANEWLANVKPSIKESSFTRYHRSIHRYILPHFNSMKLENITLDVINDFKTNLAVGCALTTKPLAAKTVSDIMSVLKLFLEFCEKYGYHCPDFNKLFSMKNNKKVPTVLPNSQRSALERTLWEEHSSVGLGVLLALYTGVRIGELCALKWENIDIEGGMLCIHKTLERVADLNEDAISKTKIIIAAAKTDSSVRVIPLPQHLRQYLALHRGKPECYVLTGNRSPTEPHCFYMKYKRLMKKHGMENINFHALRHTFATQCVELGFDIKSLSEILGHSNVTTTLKCYVHPSMKSKQTQMNLLTPEIICGQKLG